MRKAISLGFGVAKPWGDSDRYDFILNYGKLFWRVQVKSVWTKEPGSVRTCGFNNQSYTPDEIDFLVIYLNPENLWYVLPVSVEQKPTRIYISSVRSGRRGVSAYRERWDFFREDAKQVVSVI